MSIVGMAMCGINHALVLVNSFFDSVICTTKCFHLQVIYGHIHGVINIHNNTQC